MPSHLSASATTCFIRRSARPNFWPSMLPSAQIQPELVLLAERDGALVGYIFVLPNFLQSPVWPADGYSDPQDDVRPS